MKGSRYVLPFPHAKSPLYRLFCISKIFAQHRTSILSFRIYANNVTYTFSCARILRSFCAHMERKKQLCAGPHPFQPYRSP